MYQKMLSIVNPHKIVSRQEQQIHDMFIHMWTHTHVYIYIYIYIYIYTYKYICIRVCACACLFTFAVPAFV